MLSTRCLDERCCIPRRKTTPRIMYDWARCVLDEYYARSIWVPSSCQDEDPAGCTSMYFACSLGLGSDVEQHACACHACMLPLCSVRKAWAAVLANRINVETDLTEHATIKRPLRGMCKLYQPGPKCQLERREWVPARSCQVISSSYRLPCQDV